MKRRGFIGSLCAFLAAPAITPALSIPVESNIIYANYIPIIRYVSIEEMLMANMVRDMQEDLDKVILDLL